MLISYEAPKTRTASKDFWVKIPGRLIDDGHAACMGVYSLAVYIYIAKSVGLTGECYPTHATIARYLAISDRQVKRSINFLVEKGYISRRLEGRIGEQRNYYRIIDPSLASWDGGEQKTAKEKHPKKPRDRGKKQDSQTPGPGSTCPPSIADDQARPRDTLTPPPPVSQTPGPGSTCPGEIDKDQIAKDLNIPPTPQGVEKGTDALDVEAVIVAEPIASEATESPELIASAEQPQHSPSPADRSEPSRSHLPSPEYSLMYSSAHAFEAARQAVASKRPWLIDPARRIFHPAMYGAVLLSKPKCFVSDDGTANTPKIHAHLKKLLASDVGELEIYWDFAQRKLSGERTDLDSLAATCISPRDLSEAADLESFKRRNGLTANA